MELLDYQLDDIRRAVREYVDKNSSIRLIWDHGEVESGEILWNDDANERAALIEICSLIDNKYFEAVAQYVSRHPWDS